jgi:hypothetical protein
MPSDRQTLAQLRNQARQARDGGHYHAAARLERQAVELAGTLGWAGERTRALLWEGYSLRQAGEDDLALAALLQAAGERAATADPADVFSALIAIIHLSLERKSAIFCRALLEQGRRYLADIRQPWAAPLDFLGGELAGRRGDFASAWDWHCRAWAGWRNESPRLTAATHLWALCRVAFRRRDPAELERLTETLAELRPVPVLERQLAPRARLLLWRARRATVTSGDHSEPAPIESVLALLAAATEGVTRDFGVRHEALQVLALAGCWETVDDALLQHPLNAECFANALLLGDLALNRARAALKLPPMDVDYGDFSTHAIGDLSEAERCYQAALSLAAAEDERLDTGWHGETLRQRLGWI